MSRTVFFAALAALLFTGACGRDARYYVNRGNKLAGESHYDEAVLNYRKAIQQDARNGEAYFQMGSALLRLRRGQEAFEALSRAADLLPGRDDVSVALGDVSMAIFASGSPLGEAAYDKASAMSNRLLGRNASSFDGLRLKAGLAAAVRQYHAAEDLYARADLVKPQQPGVVMDWVQVLFLDNQPEKAEALALRLIASDKSFKPAYDVLFRYYMRAGRREDAEKILQTRVNNNPDDAAGLLELASYYADASRESDMQKTLRGMLDNPRRFPLAHLQVGDFYAGRRRWDEAAAQFDQGAKSGSKDRIVYLRKICDVRIAQGNTVEAEAVVDQILKEQPGDLGAQAVKASLLLATLKPENIAKSISIYQALADKRPDDAELQFNLGRALAANGDLSGARARLRLALQKRPDMLRARLELVELSRKAGDYAGALEYADQILAAHPEMAEIRLVRAVALMNTGKHAEARAELTRLLKALPGNQEVRLEIATLDFADGKPGDAEREFSKLVQEGAGDRGAMAALVRMLVAGKQTERAFTVLENELKRRPNSSVTRSILAKLAVETGKYDLAVEHYQVLAAGSKSAQDYVNLGMAYRLYDDFPSAQACFQTAAGLAPNDADPLMRLAGTFVLAGRKQEALNAYRRVLKMQPKDASALNNAAYMIAETGGNLDEALKMAQQAVNLAAKQPNYADTLGWIYLRKNMTDSAVQIFRSLTASYPANPTFHYHLGMALSRKREKAAAIAEFREALSKRPSEEDRKAIEVELSKTE